MRLSLSCPAKINLFLEVVGKRPDGYHDIESVFVSIDLADTLSADASEDGVSLECDHPGMSTDGRNLVVKAAELLRRECGVTEGISFRLQKRIPAGGGLGGGSSDAAAALRLANSIWNCGLSNADLAELGGRVGADVPFFLHGGVCLCEGKGERITRLPFCPTAHPFILALPPIHSDTAAAYKGLRLPPPGQAKRAAAFMRAMERGDVDEMAATAFNRFEESVFAALPGLAALHAGLEKTASRRVRMSGSGSGLWLFADAADGMDAGVREWGGAGGVPVVSAQPVPGL